MKMIRAKQALLPDGWAKNVEISIGDDGRIAEVVANRANIPSCGGILLPAPVNAHSHAFQRAMAGLTEHRGPDPRDSFWTWRQMMYRFMDRLTPEQLEAITAFVQMEMLEAGYAACAEFHYVHHQSGGTRYENLAEMSERVAAAADTSGIGLSLLPVHYQFGGCDRRPLGPGQIRFGNDREQFHRLRENAGKALAPLPQDAALGVAAHSLRAVQETDLSSMNERFPTGPIHLHLAEQKAEVEEVQEHWGQRPVEWALDNMDLNERWCLIHCTQLQPHETQGLAATGAVAGLCPITESNLGDGIFDGNRWMGHDGRIAIGSDSNVRIALAEELRTLDYSQRLRDGTRAALATQALSTGRRLYEAILKGGARAAGRNAGSIAGGQWADLLMLDDRSVYLAGRDGDIVLDSWIFAGDDRLVTDVWSAGRHLVTEGRHRNKAAIENAFRQTLKELADVL